VLRLLRDRLRIAITPEKIEGVRIKRGLTPRITETHTVACERINGGAAWQPALIAMPELLERLGAISADVTLVLSNKFVRYTLVPWSAELGSAREETAFAQHCFAAIHGTHADQWELRLSPASSGEPRVASAIDRALLKSLRELFAGTRLRICSIQPYLMAALNRCRRSLQSGDCFFLLPERSVYACAVRSAGSWVAVHTGVANGELADELAMIVDREIIWAGLSKPLPVYLYAPQHAGFVVPPQLASKVNSLLLQPRFGSGPSDSQYAMAMSVE
jgi:hypothetical protein